MSCKQSFQSSVVTLVHSKWRPDQEQISDELCKYSYTTCIVYIVQVPFTYLISTKFYTNEAKFQFPV